MTHNIKVGDTLYYLTDWQTEPEEVVAEKVTEKQLVGRSKQYGNRTIALSQLGLNLFIELNDAINALIVRNQKMISYHASNIATLEAKNNKLTEMLK